MIHDFILKCKSENKAIVFSSHNMYETEKLCDRIIIIHKGKVVASGTIEQLKKIIKKILLKIYLLNALEEITMNNIMTIVKKNLKIF
ncbi:hypothetical protein SD457_12940 [Coprobacillaceae bacterium CR2/5/TPMF4]|nr:hypothetical protein SD457_12940 [Coprobacillaceae bacterium CR2/5/TPMF4]